MKIGIISSGNDTLTLFKILSKFDHSYEIFRDQTLFPFGTKDFSYTIAEIEKKISFLLQKGVEKIILDPVYELYFLHHTPFQNQIFPLFSTYLNQFVFPYSLVGKIGILTDFASKEEIQHLIEQEAEKFSLTSKQKNTKNFHSPFCYRVKAASSRIFNIQDLGVHNPYLIKTMKNDLKYFKDAKIDSLIFCHYRMFEMQRSVKICFNAHKTRFHDFSFLEESFKILTEKEEKSDYKIHIYSNQDKSFLLQEKKLIRKITRGTTIPYTFEIKR